MFIWLAALPAIHMAQSWPNHRLFTQVEAGSSLFRRAHVVAISPCFFFEVLGTTTTPGPVAKKRTDELLAWWTWKIFPTRALSEATARDSTNTLRE
ncbi:hypothetical protein DXG01_013945 [Tephrocybe rancida]|nr:hypothetical protein DXG01_013945 [Tephrocybe rancida]